MVRGFCFMCVGLVKHFIRDNIFVVVAIYSEIVYNAPPQNALIHINQIRALCIRLRQAGVSNVGNFCYNLAQFEI